MEKYEDCVILPLLVKVNLHLNPQPMEVADDAGIRINEVVVSLFDAPILIEDVGMGLLVLELSLSKGWHGGSQMSAS